MINFDPKTVCLMEVHDGRCYFPAGELFNEIGAPLIVEKKVRPQMLITFNLRCRSSGLKKV